jgi:hypothetical protein
VGAGIIDQLVLVVQAHVGGPHPRRTAIPADEATTREGCWRRERAFPRTPSWLRRCASSHTVSD